MQVPSSVQMTKNRQNGGIKEKGKKEGVETNTGSDLIKQNWSKLLGN